MQRRISADSAASRLNSIDPGNAVEAARKEMALDLVADLRRLDASIAAIKKSTAAAVEASGTRVTDVFGVGPIVAALLIGHTGDITRFPTKGHYASYNATAPIEASSAKVVRHRLNQRAWAAHPRSCRCARRLVGRRLARGPGPIDRWPRLRNCL